MGYHKKNKVHIVVAVAVIRNDEGKYLVLKRSDDEIAYPSLYTFPGGKVEDNESMQEALENEVLEEAGLKLKPGKILIKDKSFIRPVDQTVKVFSYLCSAVSCDKVVISEDFTDYRWVDLEGLRKLDHVGIEEELIKAEEIYNSGVDLKNFFVNSVREDIR